MICKKASHSDRRQPVQQSGKFTRIQSLIQLLHSADERSHISHMYNQQALFIWPPQVLAGATGCCWPIAYADIPAAMPPAIDKQTMKRMRRASGDRSVFVPDIFITPCSTHIVCSVRYQSIGSGKNPGSFPRCCKGDIPCVGGHGVSSGRCCWQWPVFLSDTVVVGLIDSVDSNSSLPCCEDAGGNSVYSRPVLIVAQQIIFVIMCAC